MNPRTNLLFLDRLEVRFGTRIGEFSDTLLETLYALWLDGELHGAGGMCDRCGKREGIRLVEAMTVYSETEGNPDPNHPTPYCSECAQEYEEHWQAMWDEYNSGLL